MKITKIKIFQINPGNKVSFGTGWGKNYIITKIYTDSGITGIGEAFGTGKAKTIEASILEFGRWLQGKDPTRILKNWYAFFRGSRYPLGTATMAALSSLEHALWDIAGKSCGLPVYRMLGGPFRNKIRLYASGYLAQPLHFDIEGNDLIEACRANCNAGFTAVKVTPQPDDWNSISQAAIINESIKRVKMLREALGEDVDICLDYHGRDLGPTEAIKLARNIEEYNPLFLEEPALSENPDSLAEIKTKTTIPIAAGERCISRDRLREILEKKAVHILQLEPTANGGILETVKWAAFSEIYHILIAPHHACSALSLIVCCHIDACLPNFLIQECNVNIDSTFTRDIFKISHNFDNGYMILSDVPGLGIDLDEEAAKKYPYKPYDRPIIIKEDGSIGLE